MGKVSIYKSAFDKEPAHEMQAEGKLLDWLIENIGGFDPLSSWHPFTLLINGVLVDQRYWPVTRIKSDDIVEWRAMPQDPVSWTLTTWLLIASAAISVGSLVYAMSMKKGVSGSGASAQGSSITSASATANQPKLFGVVRELFGQHICYPDYLNQPRKWFSGITNTLSDGPNTPAAAGFGYEGGCLLPDGRVLLSPVTTGHPAIYDPASNTCSQLTAPVSFANNAYGGAVCLPNGWVVFIPRSASVVYVWDSVSNKWLTQTIDVPVATNKWRGGVIAQNGDVIMIPNTYDYVGRLSFDTFTYSDSSIIPSIANTYMYGASIPDGRVIFAPFLESAAIPAPLIYTPCTQGAGFGGFVTQSKFMNHK